MFNLTGQEKPAEVFSLLQEEGWWYWDADSRRQIWTNGTLYCKVELIPSFPTLNLLESSLIPSEWETSTKSVIVNYAPCPTLPPIHKSA